MCHRIKNNRRQNRPTDRLRLGELCLKQQLQRASVTCQFAKNMKSLSTFNSNKSRGVSFNNSRNSRLFSKYWKVGINLKNQFKLKDNWENRKVHRLLKTTQLTFLTIQTSRMKARRSELSGTRPASCLAWLEQTNNTYHNNFKLSANSQIYLIVAAAQAKWVIHTTLQTVMFCLANSTMWWKTR